MSLKLFNQPWDAVPSIFIDVETTGVDPCLDRAVQVALVRFEGGKPVGEFVDFVQPGIPIPEAASAIHGIKDHMVGNALSIAAIFSLPDVRPLLEGAMPGAYNQSFDRKFVPVIADGLPWFDPLIIVREIDRYASGKGRHKLEATCARHGIELTHAHNALSDARAAGQLFYRLGEKAIRKGRSVGELLKLLGEKDNAQWWDHMSWRAKQPAREGDTAR